VIGSVYFAGPVGDSSPLTSISVAGASNFYGGPVITLGSQTYMDSATVGGNTTLTGTTIHFFDSVDGVSGAEKPLTHRRQRDLRRRGWRHSVG
jgi:hypothetical protein